MWAHSFGRVNSELANREIANRGASPPKSLQFAIRYSLSTNESAQLRGKLGASRISANAGRNRHGQIILGETGGATESRTIRSVQRNGGVRRLFKGCRPITKTLLMRVEIGDLE